MILFKRCFDCLFNDSFVKIEKTLICDDQEKYTFTLFNRMYVINMSVSDYLKHFNFIDKVRIDLIKNHFKYEIEPYSYENCKR
ncbi:P10.2 [Mycoplasma phage P1]|uniref:P10.2 n=1 Tax=Mycoplasma phage P1 TaxID=2905920 RepID=Q9FZR4_9CAUD|nr:P10.2 [Mycoplasma phage P1]AAG01280.1 P10.2 [Mycoplasma phage P1]